MDNREEEDKNSDIAYTGEHYDEDFKDKKTVLDYALDIRKFEIDLYWKRATYFWAFIAATMTGYLMVQSSTMTNKADYSVMLACVGIIFSFAWFYVNKGSKQWQENWENHVSLLEDNTIGPLYKVILTREKPTCLAERFRQYFLGPGPYSVSKINQLISFFVFLLWLWILLAKTLYFNRDAAVNWMQLAIIVATAVICAIIHFSCHTDLCGHTFSVRKIMTTIHNDSEVKDV